MSSTTMQTTTQPQPTTLGSSPMSSRQYLQQQQQQQQQAAQQFHNQQMANASPSSSRRPTSRRPSGNNTSSPTVNSPRQPQLYSPAGSNTTASDTTPRARPLPPSTNASPATPTVTAVAAHSAYNQQLEVRGGPPIPPPPRTSSQQRVQTSVASSSATNGETAPASRKTNRPADDRPASSRVPNSNDARGPRDRGTSDAHANTSDRERSKDDASSSAAAARARRRAQQSPREEGPQRSSSTREPRSRQPAAAVQSQSSASMGGGSGVGPSREASAVLNRLIVTDPEVDIERERERMAEAVPRGETATTGLGLAGNERAEDTGRGGGKSRQDHSGSNSRRKETKFGDYILGQTLGEGEFGKVKMGWKRDGGVQVAIKLIRRESLGSNPSRLPKIYREISILRELSHPNIVRLHEMVETDHHIGIILEYASGGELFDYILNHRYLKDQPARRLFAQLISGVGYLHKKGIVHRDLKLENLLLDRNRNIIITDFGFANTFDPTDELSDEIEYNLGNKEFVKRHDLERVNSKGHRRGDLMQTSCGSPCYAAPELVVSDSLYTGMKVDVWSCGVILYAMLAGYLPFDDDPANPEGDNINLLYKYIVSTPLTFPEYVTPHARDLLRRILVPNPRKRADLFEVARHSWLSEYSHVVSFITSSTTTTGDIANTTVTADDHADGPLLARSASVREPPTRSHHHTAAPVAGPSQKHGNVDQESQAAANKMRNTIQIEYVQPESQTVRGESSAVASGAGPSDPATSMTTATSKTRARAGSQGSVEVTGGSAQAAAVAKAASMSRPLPKEPGNTQVPQLGALQNPASPAKAQQRSTGYQQNMPPPQSRPARDVPRSVSDSTGIGAPAVIASTSTARPTTGNSMASIGDNRLPSRGSYSRPGQPVAPTVTATNTQGRLAQPKTGKPYVISAPIPQTDMSPMGRPSTTQMPPKLTQMPSDTIQNQGGRGHKRSNTVGGIGEKIFGRSGSIFGGSRSQAAPSQEQPMKSYPPTSMAGASVPAAGSPRQSVDSRRSTSFGFGRKNSGLTDKPRRFSLLPASFSLKNFGASSKEAPPPATAHSLTEQRDYIQSSRSKGGLEPQNVAHGRGQSRSTSRGTTDSIPIGYDGSRDIRTGSPVELGHRAGLSVSNTRQQQSSSRPPNQENFGSGSLQYPAFPNAQGQSGLTTGSESSFQALQNYEPSPPGYNNYQDDRRGQGKWGKGPGVLQKNQRRFVDAYEHEGHSGYAPPGHNSGTSGAARKVMDFFRRRGKARAENDR